jgi:hypothetical protein
MSRTVIHLVTDNTPGARLRRWHKHVLAHPCPTCSALTNQPCDMPPRVPCLRTGQPHSIRFLRRRYHLTRADAAYRALRNR